MQHRKNVPNFFALPVLERKSGSKSPEGSIALPITAEKTAILQAIKDPETGLTCREDTDSPGKDSDEEQRLIKVKEEAMDEDEESEEGKADLVDDDGSDSPKGSDLDAKLEEAQVSPSTLLALTPDFKTKANNV